MKQKYDCIKKINGKKKPQAYVTGSRANKIKVENRILYTVLFYEYSMNILH